MTYNKNFHLNLKCSTDADLTHRPKAKLFSVVESLYNDYQETRQTEHAPACLFPQIRERGGEGFTASLYRGALHLEADSPLAAVYGLAQLKAAASSRHLPDYLGASTPCYAWRPLWLNGDLLCSLTPEICLFLPSFLCALDVPLEEQPVFRSFCLQTLEKGFNTVILGSCQQKNAVSQTQPPRSLDLQALCRAFHAYGLKIILKPTWRCLDPAFRSFLISPFDPHFRSYLAEHISHLKSAEYDGLMWESQSTHPQFMQHPLADAASEAEAMLEELKGWEQNINSGAFFFYYLSATKKEEMLKQAQRLAFLCQRAGRKTLVVFSAVAGDPWEDFLPPHPVWDHLRQLPDPLQTPLLPLVNVGAIQQGEGLWPVLTPERIDAVLGRFHRHAFAGMVALTNRFPDRSGLLACNLWVAGQALWRPLAPSLLMDTWFRAYRSDLSFMTLQKWFNSLANLTLELRHIQALTREDGSSMLPLEDCRLKAESLLAQLADLQAIAQKEKGQSNSPHASIADYFYYFCRDARRIIFHFLQSHRLPFSSFLTGQDMQKSFWSEAAQGASQGVRQALAIHFALKPFRGDPGSAMEQIYRENTLVD